MTYGYACYCTTSEYFGYTCAYSRESEVFTLMLNYSGLALQIIPFITIIFVVFIPKLVYSFKNKRWRNIITISMVLSSQVFSLVSYSLLVARQQKYFIIFAFGALSTGYFTLLAWIKWYLHLVMFIKSKIEKNTLCSYSILFIGYAITISFIIGISSVFLYVLQIDAFLPYVLTILQATAAGIIFISIISEF